MYKVIDREVLGPRRYGRYEVEFSYPWDSEARNIYLVSLFTSYFPGRVRLSRIKDRGYARVKLVEGEYPYFFLTDSYKPLLDDENRDVIRISIDSRELEASLAKVGTDILRKSYEEGGFHPEHVVHLESDPSYIHEYFGHTIVRIKAVKGELKEVSVEFVRRNGERGLKNAENVYSYGYTDFFQAVIEGSLKGYRFILNVGNSLKTFGHEGVDGRGWITPKIIKGVNNTVWWLGAIYYLIFVDSFERGSDKPLPNYLPRASAVPRTRGYLGGDLEGILRRINYLRDLGIEAVYLTPIYESSTYHRYDVIDHLKIDPLLGDEETFQRLIRRFHDGGMRVVLDLVIHHTSPCSPFFRDAILKGASSRYWSWYLFKVDDIDEVPRDVYDALVRFIGGGCREAKALKGIPFYESFYNSWMLAKLNHENEEVTRYFEEVLAHWLGREVDGFRVDVANALPDSPLKRIYERVKRYGIDKALILEISYGLEYYPIGSVADSAMNYDLRRYLLDFFVYRRIDAYRFASNIMRQYLSLPVYAANALYNLLGSHDTPRIATIVGKSDLLRTLYTFLFVIYGSPSIYYGDEVGLEGLGDPDCRRPMIWDEESWDKSLLSHIKRLIGLRKRFRVLRHGFSKVVPLTEDVVKVIRYIKGEEFAGFFNRSSSPSHFELSYPAYDVERDVYLDSGGKIEIPGGYRLLYRVFLKG